MLPVRFWNGYAPSMHRITRMVLMFQREVAERIRAHPGDSDYGALSVYTALYWNVTDHFRVGAGNFNPQPKVDAEVLVFTPLVRRCSTAADEQTILRTIRAAFTAPRKTLRNSLASGLGARCRRLPQAMLELRSASTSHRARRYARRSTISCGSPESSGTPRQTTIHELEG